MNIECRMSKTFRFSGHLNLTIFIVCQLVPYWTQYGEWLRIGRFYEKRNPYSEKVAEFNENKERPLDFGEATKEQIAANKEKIREVIKRSKIQERKIIVYSIVAAAVVILFLYKFIEWYVRYRWGN